MKLVENTKDHKVVDHGAGEYVNGNAYTNNAEGYFSQLKRCLSAVLFTAFPTNILIAILQNSIIGIILAMKKMEIRMIQAIKKSNGKRLTYKDLIAK